MTPNTSDSELLHKIADTVIEMNAKLFDSQIGFVPTTASRLNNHTNRLSRLEKWAWSITGGGAAIVWLIAHHLLSTGK